MPSHHPSSNDDSPREDAEEQPLASEQAESRDEWDEEEPNEENEAAAPPEAAAPQPSEGRGSRRSRRRRISSAAAMSHFIPPQRPRWEAWVLAGLPLLIIVLSGGRTVFAKGLAVCAIGALLLLRPAGFRLPKICLGFLIAALLAPLAAYLPAEWLEASTEWRRHLVEDWGIHLAASSTTQPWLTFEAWALFAAGLAWLAWCCSRGTTVDDRRTVVRLMVAGSLAITVFTLLDHAEIYKVPWWQFPAELGDTIGPFANRNHTSSLAALASVLAAAAMYDAYRRKSRQWIFYLLCIVPFFLLIVRNTSKAGLLMFSGGMLCWMASASMRKGLFKKGAIAAAVIAAAISMLVIFGGGLLSRWKTEGGDNVIAGMNSRLALYQDSLDMTARSPWTGIGLGNFADVYPQFTSQTHYRFRFLHPESDFFWLLAEGGMLAVFSSLMLLGSIAWLTGPWLGKKSRESLSRQDRRFRNALAITAMLAALHGMVDVPNHSLGYGLVSAMLLGLAVRPGRVRIPAAAGSALASRLAGAAALAAGACWLAIASGVPAPAFGKSTSMLLNAQAETLSGSSRDAEALRLADRAVRLNPLNWKHYFLRAQIHLRLGHSDDTALTDFGRARAVEPFYPLMCLAEGQLWLDRQSPLAIQAFREVIRREPGRLDYFTFLVGSTYNSPALDAEVRKLATTAELKRLYLLNCSAGPPFTEMLNALLQQHPKLDCYEPEHRLEIFRFWQQKGDRAALRSDLEKYAAWREDGWPVLAEEYAKSGDYERACKLALDHLTSPVSASVSGAQDIAQLEQNARANPLDARIHLDLYFAYRSRSRLPEAQGVIEKLLGLPSAPAYVSYEMGQVLHAQQQFARAWDHLSKYIQATVLQPPGR